MPGPDISILIAAYRLRAEVPVAVASVFGCAGEARVEVIVASDDGTDYARCLPPDPRLRFTAPGPIASGAHAARNRALAIARGEFVLILDGDDALEGPPGAMAEALALARLAGCAIVPSIVRAPDGTEIRRIPRTISDPSGWPIGRTPSHRCMSSRRGPGSRPSAPTG